MKTLKFIISCVFVIQSVFFAACGGGGGGGFEGAARVQLDVNKHSIDSGERTTVTTKLNDVDPLGIMLKFKYPAGINYVTGTALLKVNDVVTAIAPTHNVLNESDNYLVFFISQSSLGSKARGDLIFELVGYETIENGEIAVDADLDDPNIANTVEFDAGDPNFTEEDVVTIEVVDS
jgi:hypothetical protein